uniref:TOG domain-containing protein n=1 Tax=Amorphochlora amoebiformis TaxID=1561963 RepID=A0A7S0H266_9EUKA
MAAVAAQAEEVKMGLQRHINLLRDPNKVKRRRAIQHIANAMEEVVSNISEDQKLWVGVLKDIFYEKLAPSLVAALQDASERPREISVSVLQDILPHLDIQDSKSGLEICNSIVHSIHNQIGIHPIKETSEEVRLLQVGLLKQICEAAPQVIQDCLGDLVDIATVSAGDTFPKVKIEVGSFVDILSKNALSKKHSLPSKNAEKIAERLAKSLIKNLKHQRFRVRLATLNALSSIVTSRGKVEQWLKEALPQIAKLTADRTPSVRIQTSKVIGSWLSTLSPLQTHERVKLLLILLSTIADPDPNCKASGIAELSKLGKKSEDTPQTPVSGLKDSKSEPKPGLAKGELEAKEIPLNIRQWWKSRKIGGQLYPELPGKEERSVALKYCKALCRPLLTQLKAWTDQDRVRGAGSLCGLIILAHEGLVELSCSILSAIECNLEDLEDPATQMLRQAASAIGCLMPVEAWLETVMKALTATGEGGHSSWLIILQNCLTACPPEKLKTFRPKIAQIIRHERLCRSDDRPTRFFTRDAMRGLIESFEGVSGVCEEKGENSCKIPEEVTANLFWGLIQLHYKSPTEIEFQKTEAVITSLALAHLGPPKESKNQVKGDVSTTMQVAMELYDKLFSQTLTRILGPNPQPKKVVWSEESDTSGLLVTLLQRSAPIIHNHLEVVVPFIVEACKTQDNSPTVRIHMLSLLVKLVGSSQTSDWKKYSVTIVEDIILPNMVWRNGSTAQTIRFTALKVLVTILQRTKDCYPVCVPLSKHLETLETCLDDDDNRIRLGMCSVFLSVFECGESKGVTSRPKLLHELQLTKLYPKLVDRLDDSDDEVRCCIGPALASLVCNCFPPKEAFDRSGHAYTYIVKHCLIHLDDKNQHVKRSMLILLKRISHYNTQIFVELVRSARTRHKTPDACDLLLKQVEG